MNAVPVQWIGGIVGHAESFEPHIDRTYTIARIEWMLENYHALLSRKPLREDDVRPGATTVHSAWWSSQAYWRKVDRKADLDAAIDRLRGIDGRMYLIMELRYRAEPQDRLQWDDIADSLGISRMHVWRLYRRAVHEVAWWLGGVSDG